MEETSKDSIMSTYKDTWYVKLLHGFPHLDFSFQETNSTFEPEKSNYQESLLLWAAAPVAFILLVLFMASCCLCIQCVKKKPQKAPKTTCLRILVAIFIIFSIGAVSVGFFGNEQTSKGSKEFFDALDDTNQTMGDISSTLDTLVDVVDEIDGRNGVQALKTVLKKFGDITANKTLLPFLNKIDEHAKKTRNDIDNVKSNVPGLLLQKFSKEAVDVEFIRWIVTIVLLCFSAFILLTTSLGCYKKSRCLLMTSVILGFFGLLLVWAGSGAYLGISVGMSDLCYDPNGFVESLGENKAQREVIKEYATCQVNKDTPEIFRKEIDDAVKEVSQANSTLDTFINESARFIPMPQFEKPVHYLRVQLDYALGNVTSLGELLNCRTLHKDYKSAVEGVCETALVGIALLLLMLPFAGICMIVVQCLLPRVWYLAGKRRGYRPVDDSDPFCHRPPPYNDYGTIEGGGARGSCTLEYYRDLRRSADELQSEERVPMNDSPPPAYHPGRFPPRHDIN
ncbi:protein tweety homolog 1-A-like isoform X2 [Ostrea edulis]|uniref:protein tweety homolog 1-A-like isoform X2 n=1 Tax=Ostrea edulis TaxID=37623 RepID=UPI002094C2AE|nr:protein tweety homolog 1-A-like isoform X2 [Ostrea edulis]